MSEIFKDCHNSYWSSEQNYSVWCSGCWVIQAKVALKGSEIYSVLFDCFLSFLLILLSPLKWVTETKICPSSSGKALQSRTPLSQSKTWNVRTVTSAFSETCILERSCPIFDVDCIMKPSLSMFFTFQTTGLQTRDLRSLCLLKTPL